MTTVNLFIPVVIAYAFSQRDRMYTAKIITVYELCGFSLSGGFNLAKAWYTEDIHCRWFEGEGSFGRAKVMARLLAEDFRVNGGADIDDRIRCIEISLEDERVYRLSKKGNRL